MAITALSDLTYHLLRQRQVSQTRAQLETAGQELTTGQVADIRSATRGDLTKLFSIDKSLSQLSQRQNALKIAQGKASVTQDRLTLLQDVTNDTGVNLQIAVERGDFVSARTYANDARHRLSQVVSALNTTYQGKSLFSGAAEDRAALAGADEIVADINAIVGSATDATDAIAAIDAYFFDVGGGFETDIYLGATEEAADVAVSETATTDISIRADNPAIRSVLRGLALATAVAEGGFAGDVSEQAALLLEAGNSMINAKEGVIQLGADLGMAQNQIENGLTMAGDDIQALQIARNEIAGVDPYEAGSRFTALEGQLSSMYTVTARLSALNLTNFLR